MNILGWVVLILCPILFLILCLLDEDDIFNDEHDENTIIRPSDNKLGESKGEGSP